MVVVILDVIAKHRWAQKFGITSVWTLTSEKQPGFHPVTAQEWWIGARVRRPTDTARGDLEPRFGVTMWADHRNGPLI